MRIKIKTRSMIILCLAALTLVGIFAWIHFHKTPSSIAKTTSNLPTAQRGYKNPTDKSVASSNDVNQGGAVDTKGNSNGPSQGTDSISSDSGAITLVQPNAGDQLRSGSVISGSAKVSTVYFRLVDDSVGVVAQGPLTVNDGKYSGTLQFTAKGKTGILKLYSLDGDELEVNRLQTNVTF